MSKMLKLILPFLITCAFASELSESLSSIKKKHNLPGLAAAFYQQDALVEIASVGVRKIGHSSLIQTTDKFHLGSCSKAMAATLAGIFVEKGLVSWNSKLRELLPEINLNADYEQVSFDMLFAHRSGLTKSVGWGDLWRDLNDPNLTPEEGRELVAKTLLVKEPEVKPGSKWHYSNAGYMVAGHILEKIAKKPFERLLKELLFEPMDMSSCEFGPASDPDSIEPKQPWGHHIKNGKPLPIHADNPPAYAPAGGVHCSLQDWSKFLQAHLDGFNGKGGIVRIETFKKLHTPYPVKDSEYTYGGWGITKRQWAGGTTLTHGGSNTFNTVSVWLAPKKNAILMGATNIKAYKAIDDTIVDLLERNLKSNVKK